MTRAVIALGANLGDRETAIRSALARLTATAGVEVLAVSPLSETVALTLDGPDADRPAYLNGVALIETALEPLALLDVLGVVEREHGRDRSGSAPRWGDRTLDLDIVDYGGIRMSTARLTLPHPRAAERDFVLRPWLDVDPDAVLDGRRVADLLEALT